MQNLDTKRIVQMICYSVFMGGAAGFAALQAGAKRQQALCAAMVAVCTNLGAYWATSPKHPARRKAEPHPGQTVDASSAESVTVNQPAATPGAEGGEEQGKP